MVEIDNFSDGEGAADVGLWTDLLFLFVASPLEVILYFHLVVGDLCRL
jgi:hypothetical protein